MVRGETGLRNHRVVFTRETTIGQMETDPEFNYFSDVIRSVSFTPDASVEAQRGLGSADPIDFVRGVENHTVEVTYDLQQWFSASGDPAYDGLARSNGYLPATHLLWIRTELPNTNVHLVGLGGHIGTVTLSGDPGSPQPITVTLSYQFERVRLYAIDQPPSSTTLDVVSTDSNDTMDITIEDEGASVSETLTLTGTTSVTSTESFANIDAVQLASAPTGNITISDGSGTNFVTIYGADEYEGIEGDLGTPVLGAGSLPAAAIGTAYEKFLGDTIERPSGTDLAYAINSAELTVENNLELTPRMAGFAQSIDVGDRETQLSATVFGPSDTYAKVIEYLRKQKNNIIWTLSGGTLTLPNAALVDPGTRSKEAGQAVMTLDNTFAGEGLTIS